MKEEVQGRRKKEKEEKKEQRRQRKSKEKEADKEEIVMSDGEKAITGKIIGVSGNDVYLYSQTRGVRVLQRNEPWTPETLSEVVAPAWANAYTPLERTRDVFPWQPS